MEIILKFIFSLEFTIALELGLILFHMPTKENIEEILKKNEGAHTTRREVNGICKTPLGDSYRKNTRGLYVPIQPNSKMLDGDDEE